MNRVTCARLRLLIKHRLYPAWGVTASVAGGWIVRRPSHVTQAQE